MNPKLQHFSHPTPPGKPRAFELLKIVQILAASRQNGVQMPYSIVGFVCQMPLLKNNCRRLFKIIDIEELYAFHKCLTNTSQLLKTFFVSQSLTNVLSLPLNSSILSKHVLIAATCGCKRRLHMLTSDLTHVIKKKIVKRI